MTNKDGAVILAAGKGTRMGAPVPKVLCQVLGKPMIDYVIEAAQKSVDDVCIVVGYKSEKVISHLGDRHTYAFQTEQLGTGHAVMQAEDFLMQHQNGDILILCGDAPLMDERTLAESKAAHKSAGNAVTVITAVLDNPQAYGRIVRKDGKIAAIVEKKDCSEEQLKIREINSGVYWVKGSVLLKLLSQIKNQNSQKEYYLTDIVAIAIKSGKKVGAYISENPDIVLGANTAQELENLNNRAKKYFER
jgi:bifunctional UDP-N-acetylglucosamine pyrophosphorylase/glucosamine-1-phosphate N-acetyltransferase